MDWSLAVALWIFCGMLAGAIAQVRGTGIGKAAILGLILGPLGVLLVAIEKPVEPR